MTEAQALFEIAISIRLLAIAVGIVSGVLLLLYVINHLD